MKTEEQIERARQQLISEDISSFPSLFQQARNLAKQVWVSSAASVLHGKPLLASADKAYARLQICQGCEFFRDTRCLKCGCFMEKKTHVDAAACPINKWGPELQVMLSAEQMKALHQQSKTEPIPTIPTIPTMKLIDLSAYPENEQAEIKKLAQESVTRYDGRFAYGGEQYQARLSPKDGKLIIYQIIPNSHRGTLLDHLTLAERDELNILAKNKLQQANNEPVVFSFKDAQFQVSPLPNSRGIRLSLAPGTTAQFPA